MSGRSIVHVMDYGGTTGGSFIPALCSLGRKIARAGDRFAVLATPVAHSTWGEELRASGCELSFVNSTEEVTQALRSLAPDVVHSHFSRYDVAAAGTSARTYWHVHSYRQRRSLFSELKSQAKYRFFSRNVREWICVSQGVRSELVARGVPVERTEVIHNGIDVNFFRPPSLLQRRAARARLQIPDSDSVVLFFDRTPEKGGSTLRDALSLSPGHRLLVTGGSRTDWETLAKRYDVSISPRAADPRELYWAADALALPSLGEGFSFVLAEAAACGLPIAASDIPPVREILGGVDGVWVAPVGDSRALSRALGHALANGATRAGRERIVSSFSVERWGDDLMRLYDL